MKSGNKPCMCRQLQTPPWFDPQNCLFQQLITFFFLTFPNTRCHSAYESTYGTMMRMMMVVCYCYFLTDLSRLRSATLSTHTNIKW
jgi:hypothetical protein